MFQTTNQKIGMTYSDKAMSSRDVVVTNGTAEIPTSESAGTSR